MEYFFTLVNFLNRGDADVEDVEESLVEENSFFFG